MMNFCNDLGVGKVYALGGLGTGSEVEEPNTRAVLTSEEQEARVSPHAKIQRGKENRPGVTGLFGLLIGMAEKNGIEGVSLLGETHGSYPDAKAAKTVLDSLSKIENIEIDLSSLDEKAEKLEEKKEEFKRKMMMTSTSLMVTLETQFNQMLNQTAIGFGIAFSALMITRLFFQTPIGKISDKEGRKPFIFIGMIVMGLFTILLPYVKSTTELTIARMGQGLASAGIAAPGLALAGDKAGDKKGRK